LEGEGQSSLLIRLNLMVLVQDLCLLKIWLDNLITVVRILQTRRPYWIIKIFMFYF